MNQERKAEWVTALRSGEYKQGLGALRTSDNKFCCLGVLCDIAVKRKDAPEWENPTANYPSNYTIRFPGQARGNSGLLPWRLAEDYDLPNHLSGKLMELNDDKGKSFEEIATYIEENL